MEPQHYPLLCEWLNAPHLRQWWGDPEEELGHIRDMVEGRDSTQPFLIMLDGAPKGYIQCWFLGHRQNETWVKDHPWLSELPADTVGVDLSLGDAAQLSQGIGSAALSAFSRRLVDESCESIIVDPDRKNRRAVGAYAKAGFRRVFYLEGRTGDVLIMQYAVTTNEMTS